MANYVNIDNQGLLTLVSQIFGKVDSKLTNRTVDVIDENSDSTHVPSALAVFNALKSVSPSMNSETVIGSIDTVDSPSATTIYLQKDDEEDETWSMYLYVNDGWVNIGSTNIDLSNYWNKDDVDEMRNLILDDEKGDAAVKKIVGYDALLKNDTTSMDLILDSLISKLDEVYVRQDAVETISTEDITDTVDKAFNGNFEVTPPPETDLEDTENNE